MVKVKYENKFYIRLASYMRIADSKDIKHIETMLGDKYVEIPEDFGSAEHFNTSIVDLDNFIGFLEDKTVDIRTKDDDRVHIFKAQEVAFVLKGKKEDYEMVRFNAIDIGGMNTIVKSSMPTVRIGSDTYVPLYRYITDRRVPKAIVL